MRQGCYTEGHQGIQVQHFAFSKQQTKNGYFSLILPKNIVTVTFWDIHVIFSKLLIYSRVLCSSGLLPAALPFTPLLSSALLMESSLELLKQHAWCQPIIALWIETVRFLFHLHIDHWSLRFTCWTHVLRIEETFGFLMSTAIWSQSVQRRLLFRWFWDK